MREYYFWIIPSFEFDFKKGEFDPPAVKEEYCRRSVQPAPWSAPDCASCTVKYLESFDTER